MKPKDARALLRQSNGGGRRVSLDASLSLGGYVAIELTHHHPELVRGLVLSGCRSGFRGGLGLYLRIVSALMENGWLQQNRDRIERKTRALFPPFCWRPIQGPSWSSTASMTHHPGGQNPHLQGFETIALAEGCQVVFEDGGGATLRDLRPGAKIEAQGQRGSARAFLADRLLISVRCNALLDLSPGIVCMRSYFSVLSPGHQCLGYIATPRKRGF